MSGLRQSVQLAFARHELWAIETAMRFPFFAIFIHATLWVWGLPAVPVLLLLFVITEGSILGAAIMMVIGIPLLVSLCPWFFPWYFICAGLMLGRPAMAQRKRESVRARLGLSDA